MLREGIYEDIINNKLKDELDNEKLESYYIEKERQTQLLFNLFYQGLIIDKKVFGKLAGN